MRINYLAVVASAVIYWLLGALWFGKLFAERWMALEGLSMDKVQQMNPAIPSAVSFVMNLILAYALANVCIWRQADNAGKGAGVGVLVWVGFVATISFTTYLFEGRPKELFLINYGYALAGLLIMGAILGAWKKKGA